jgi:predicted glycosyltransferase
MTNCSSGPRIALYTHVTFGLGHVRHAVEISRAVAVKNPDAAILIVTSSPTFGVLH